MAINYLDYCPECDGPPVSLGTWADNLALRCRDCGCVYYQRVRDERLSEAHGCEVRVEPEPRTGLLVKGPVESLLTKLHGDGEWWRALWLVQGPCSDAEALAAADYPQAFSGGPGRGFAGGASVRRNRAGTRVLVTQSGGLDV